MAKKVYIGVGGTIAHLPASSLTTTASGWVNHSTGDNTYTNTEVEGASAEKYTFVMI